MSGHEKHGISHSVSCYMCRLKGNLSVRKGVQTMDQQKIGLFLKKLRNEKNLTQEELAEQLNVSSRTVSRWENGVSHN